MDYLDALRRNGLALVDAASRAGLTAAVPACPGWTVADLVWHTGEVHGFWRDIAERRLADRHDVRRPERPVEDALLSWYRDGVEATHAVLAKADPTTPVWTWAPRKDIGFIVRRMAQETAVHRADAELAAGSAYTIEPALAADGIDEFFEYFAGDPVKDAAPLGGTVHLHATDTPGEWVVAERDGALVVTREHGQGDAAVRASASDLLLLLWRRRGADGLEVFGDQGVLDRLVARTDLT